MAALAIAWRQKTQQGGLHWLERSVPYLACVPLGYFLFQHLPAVIKSKVVLDAETGQIKRTFIMTWLKQVGVDRVVLRDLRVRNQALHILDRASYAPSFHSACLSMITRVVNTPAFTEAGKASMFEISAVVLASEKAMQEKIKEVCSETSVEAVLNPINLPATSGSSFF